MSARRLKALLALVLLSVFALSLSMCGGDNKKAGSEQGVAALTVTASPDKVPADGTTSDITLLAVQTDGTNGYGTVIVQVTNGSLNGGGNSANVDLSNGRASLKWGCDQATKGSCVGTQTLTAKWADKVGTTTVEFLATTPVVDSGTPDAPTTEDAGDAGDAQTDGSIDAATATLTLTTSKPKIYIGAGDYATLTATVKRPDGGAIANEPVSFATDLGNLATSPDAGGAATLDAVTAANGTAQVVLLDSNAAGTATVVATRTATGQTAQVQVAIEAAANLTYVSTKCGGKDCTIMGVKRSGFNETAEVTFKVTDASNNPIANVPVSFSITNPPTGTLVTASDKTDAQGNATAIVTSGPTIGSFAVTATITTPSGTITTQSPTIGIRGAVPTNKGFTFQCNRVNIPAFASPTPPAAYTTTCNIKLVDRFNNAVGTGTSVNFKTEAGGLPNNVATQAYQTTGTNANEGTASATFTTVGDFPPVDVSPLAAAVGQYPKDRAAEPSVLDGQLTRNPRDGLVSLLAYVQGEEWFSDDNNNGTRDSGEQFVDQGEPFVDSNDNGVRDNGETYIDVNGNNAWDGPNGVWNNDTTVWAETRILYTDVPLLANSSIVPSNFGTIAAGSSQDFFAYFLDPNLNYISAGSTTLASEFTSPRSLTVQITQPFGDRYGFDLQRVLVASGTELACTAATAICKYKVVFTKWAPNTGDSSINATLVNPATATPTGGTTTFRLKATEAGTTVTLQATGAVGP